MHKSEAQKHLLAEKTKLKKISMALEDLSWSLKSMKLDTILAAADIIGKLAIDQGNDLTRNSLLEKEFRNSNSNKRFLIGILPTLFQDKQLFPTNDDIVEFAKITLGLVVRHAEKRSRYEIIGTIICETDLLNENRLINLALALEKMDANNDHFTTIIEKKKIGNFSWNETIQELLKNK